MAIQHKEHPRAIPERPNPLTRLLGATKVVGLAAPLTWIGYSTFVIDHRVPLPAALAAPRTTISRADTGEISYYANRNGNGRPIVLIHSINAGASAYEMKPLFEEFSGQRPVFAPDLPGFGFSERSDRRYTPELYTNAILAMLEVIEQVEGGFDVVALSLSGEFAARAAQQRPELFHSLTLISPSGFGSEQQTKSSEPAGYYQTSKRSYQLVAFPLWSQALYDLLVTKPSIAYFLKQLFVGPIDQGLLDYDYATTHQSGARFAPLVFISGGLFTPDIRQTVYATLDLPVLVLYDKDPFVDFDELPAFLEQHPQWHAIKITPTRGLPQFEQPERTTGAIKLFCEAIAILSE